MRKFLKENLKKIGIEVKRYHLIPDYVKYLRTLDIRTVLDIGASVGDSAVLIRAFFPDAVIHSFEPLPECYAVLQSCLNDDRFYAHNFALGDKNGEFEFYRNEHTPSSSFLNIKEAHTRAFPYTAMTDRVTVQVKRLDDIWESLKISPRAMLKIDVQGYESSVLLGADGSLDQVAAIIIEVSFIELYDNQVLFHDIYEMLTSRGFRYMSDVHRIDDPNTGMPLQANALFIRESVQ